jgi:hypothetical protein
MIPLRRLLSLLLAASPLSALASGPTGEEDMLGDFAARVAPLALSADGRFRLHVDASHVLHRVALADPSQERRAVLPFAVRAIAASRTGQKVAVRSDPGCVGLVDFGVSGTGSPALRWLDASFPEHRPGPAADPEAWSDLAPPDCAPSAPGSVFNVRFPTLALSIDGRLLATDEQVVDTETHRLVASLRGGVHRVRFVDGGRQLIVQLVGLSEGYESVPETLSEVDLAIWDLPGGALSGLQRRRMGNLTDIALAVDLQSDGTGWWIENLEPHGSDSPERPVLHHWRPHDCGGREEKDLALAPDMAWLPQLVVDPQHRWVATVREAALVVQALDDGRVLLRRSLDRPLEGALATPDGTRLFGLAGDAAEGGNVPPPGDTLVEIPIDVSGLRARAEPAAQACDVDGAAAKSRSLVRPVHMLAPLWRQVHPVPDVVPADGDSEATPRELRCEEPHLPFAGGRGSAFLRRDGTLWADQGATIAQLDPSSGKVLRSLHTPRGPKICSAVLPDAEGFFNVQGDTLTWRPLEPGNGTRRLIDRRPGWTATEITPLARAVRVVWRSARPAGDHDTPSLSVAIHDASGRRVSQWSGDAGEYDYAGDLAMPLYAPAFMPPCKDAAGAIVGAIDWNVDALGFRARACGEVGMPPRTMLWTDTDIAPRPGSPRDAEGVGPAWAHDGTIAVGQYGRRLRVFDLEQRRELAQIPLDSAVDGVTVSAALSLVVIETHDRPEDGPSRVVLTAYRFR